MSLIVTTVIALAGVKNESRQKVVQHCCLVAQLWPTAFHIDSCGWYRNVQGEPEYDDDYERVQHTLWDWKYSLKGFVNNRTLPNS